MRSVETRGNRKMKLFQTTLAVAILAGLAAQTASALAAGPLFPDKNLEAAIREELKKGDKESLKEDDLKNIYFVHAKGKKIANLAGLEKCINVESIDLARNEII